MKANRHDLLVEKGVITDDEKYYILPEQKTSYKIILEFPLYDDTTGEKLTRPSIRCMPQGDFNLMKDSGHFKGAKLEILHDPTLKDSLDNELEKQYFNLSGKKASPKWTKTRLKAEVIKLAKAKAKAEEEE